MEDEVYESISILIEGESRRPNHTKQSIGTICMVPDTIRNLSPGSFTPRIISIGPLHKEDQCVRGMEELKVTYMYRLFYKTVLSTQEDIIRECINLVLRDIIRVRACYAPSFINYNDCKLAEMMFIDGCFILELLYSSVYGTWEGDPIFENILVERAVKNDLLLLENQIPFFILEILFKTNRKCIRSFFSLIELIFSFFWDMNIFNSELTLKEDETVGHHHILGLLQSSYRPRGTGCDGRIPTNRYSAIDIAVAGVRIKQQSNGDSLLAVQFLQSFVPGFGKLFIREASFKIPVLRIEDSTTSFMWNLIAYEQCYPCSRQYVTSLAFLMDMLIDTKYDVSLIMTAKVLQHSLGKREDVTNIFSGICNGVDLRGFYYSDEWAKLDAHCNRFWPSKLISLKRIFFSLGRFYTSTTWKTLAVIGAVAIFVLTLIQTIYAVRNA